MSKQTDSASTVMRESIDRYRADSGHYPVDLPHLVDGRALREVPVDPMTEPAATWVRVGHPDGQTPGLFDVHCGATETARDGSACASQ